MTVCLSHRGSGGCSLASRGGSEDGKCYWTHGLFWREARLWMWVWAVREGASRVPPAALA